ncbi:MAG TPA: VOC family protein [Flavisolibacter sp.]|nr:VOC family protein [Flavisolibacter sp.]
MSTHPKYKIKNLSPQLLVSDLSRSIEFYQGMFGFHVDFQFDDFYAGMSNGVCSLHLKAGQYTKEEIRNRNNREDLDLVVSVEGIEALYDLLLAKQIKVIQPLRNMVYGQEFYVADPDGYIIGFISAVSA